MLKNRLAIAIVVTCIILGTVPFALGATTTATNNVYISTLYVGAPHQTPNQEYVKITNGGKSTVNLNDWKITDSKKKHTYVFSSFNLKAKSTVTLRSGLGTDTSTTLYWHKNIFIWNNHDSKNNGDTAYLYTAQGKLVSSKSG